MQSSHPHREHTAWHEHNPSQVCLPLLPLPFVYTAVGSGELRLRGSGRPGPDATLSCSESSIGVSGPSAAGPLGCLKYAHTFAMSARAGGPLYSHMASRGLHVWHMVKSARLGSTGRDSPQMHPQHGAPEAFCPYDIPTFSNRQASTCDVQRHKQVSVCFLQECIAQGKTQVVLLKVLLLGAHSCSGSTRRGRRPPTARPAPCACPSVLLSGSRACCPPGSQRAA